MFRCWRALSRPAAQGGSLTPPRVALEDHTVKARLGRTATTPARLRGRFLVEALGMAPEPFIEIPTPHLRPRRQPARRSLMPAKAIVCSTRS